MSENTSTTFQVDPPFLATDPPHWAARGLAYILLSLFLVVTVASVIVQVPETVTGSFVLVPLHGTDPIRAANKGVVSDVRVSEGEIVPAGDTLLVIQSNPVGDRSVELRTRRAQVRGDSESAVNARSEHESQQRGDDEESHRLKGRLGYLTRTLDLKKRQLALTRTMVERYKDGLTRRAVSDEESMRLQIEADKLAVDVEQAQGDYDETQSSLDKLQHAVAGRQTVYRELTRKLAEDRESARIQIAALEKELAFSAGSAFSVVAPCAGTVLRLRVNASGAVVQDGDTLGEIGCSGDRLQADLTLPQTGVALVKPGQGVKLLYDAFPYQRYGARRGSIRWVGPTSATAPESAAFRALVDVDDGAIIVRGTPRALMPGMGGHADVVVGRHSLISYAFEPIRQLKESLAGVPGK